MSARYRARYNIDNRRITRQINAATGAIAGSRVTKTYVEFSSMTDMTTPNYIYCVREAIPLPFHDCTKVVSTDIEDDILTVIKDLGGARTWHVQGNVTQFNSAQWNTPWPNPGLTPAYSLSSLVAEAKAKALANLDKPQYNFGEPIAELVSTIRDLKSPLKNIKKLVSRYKRKRDSLGIIKGKAKDLASVWSNYSFYVGPNVRTLQDVVDAYATRNYKRGNARKIYGKAKYIGSGSGTTSGNVSGWLHDRRTDRTLQVDVRAYITYSISDPDTRTELLGLRARDLPSVAWEVIPLSFLVDRVLNVKRFIHTATRFASGNVKILKSYTVVRVRETYKRRYLNLRTTTTGNSWVPSDTPPWYAQTETYDRASWEPSLFDSFTPVIPGNLFKSLSSTLDTTSVILSRLF